MKSALAVLIFISGMASAQAAHKQTASTAACVPLLKIEVADAAGSDKESVDTVTVCGGGKLIAYHSFVAPPLGTSPAERTQWDYTGKMSVSSLADLRQVMQRADIDRLANEGVIKIEKKNSMLDEELTFSMYDKPKPRIIKLRGSLFLTCGTEQPEITGTVRDVLCLFADVSESVKTGESLESESCGCKSLHNMAKDTDALAR